MARYRARISGPLLDRIDLQLQVPRVERRLLTARAQNDGETSADVRARVERARERALRRAGVPNARLTGADIERFCRPDARGQALLEAAMDRLGLSARAYHRILKLARTIADLHESEAVGQQHVSEAVGYRQLDRSPQS